MVPINFREHILRSEVGYSISEKAEVCLSILLTESWAQPDLGEQMTPLTGEVGR